VSTGQKSTEPQKNLIVLRPRESRRGYAVTQRDLEEDLYLERQMHDAAALWKIKHDTIRKHIEEGGAVEPGIREARLVVTVRYVSGAYQHTTKKLDVR
jgi:hypothetical protein